MSQINTYSKPTENLLPWYFSNLGIFVAPLSSIILRILTLFIQIHPIFLYIADTSTIFLLLFVVFSHYYKSIHAWKNYFYFSYLLLISFIAWFFINKEEEIINFYSFLILFAVFSLFFQRWFFYIFYALLNLALLGISIVQHPTHKAELFFILLATLFLVIGTLLMLIHRSKIYFHQNDYIQYLRKVINHPGIGYALFSFENNQVILRDDNESIYKLLGIEKANGKLEAVFLSGIDNRKINSMMQNQELVFEYSHQSKWFEIRMGKIEIKHYNNAFLARIYDVSDERKNEKIAIEREQKYRNLLNKNVAGFFSMDEQGQLLEYNMGFSSLLSNAGLNQSDFHLLWNYSSIKWTEIKEKISLCGKTTTQKIEFKLPKKTLVLLGNFYFEKNSEHFEASTIDITTLELVNKENKENERQFFQLFKESNDAILLSKEGKIQEVNAAFFSIFSKNKENIGQQYMWEIYPFHQKMDELKAIFSQKTPKKHFFEWKFTNEKKQEIHTEISINSFFIENQLIEQTIIRDVSEQKLREKRINTNQKILSNILESIPESILVFNKENLIFANSETYRLFGIAKSSTNETKRPIDFFVGKKNRSFFDFISQSILNEKEINGKIELENQLIVEYALLFSQFGEENHALLVLKDISPILRLEEEKLRAEMAEKSSLLLKNEMAERKKVELELEEKSTQLEAIIENSSNTLIWSIDKDFNLLSFNTQFKQEMNLYTKNAILVGMDVISLFNTCISVKGIREAKQVFTKAFKGKKQTIEGLLISDFSGEKHWFETFIGPIVDSNGQVKAITCVSHNITDKKRVSKELLNSLQEKEILLKEVHHRVKNNLQVVSSILNLQSSYVKDPNVIDALSESQNRIKSMSLIHENLYQTKDFSSLDLPAYIKNLVSILVHSYQIYDIKVNFDFDLDGIKLDLDRAIPCGLIINEIISNSLKYAFHDQDQGSISISMKQKENTFYLSIGDNGSGLPSDLDIYQTQTLGMQLIISLVEQINGTLKIESEAGTKYLIIFGN